MIGKLFHLAHLVEDLDATDRLYDEVFEDPHFVARGFQVEVEHPELGRSFKYHGAPYLFHGSPWNIARRALLLGEHNAEIYSELGVSAQELERLSSEGIV